ncbi:cohesin domain-containing protein [Clostridium septicum]|uniref:cohesin domain-containing protein n=1 Tax=Clostridium septicum TaxID=1504 RepID=UPI00272E56F8|nr:cohesin domain-containing protein [Clostridium septicum]WLF68983.1 cohesin domain-containing protein [Clostridium septicum]
MKKILTLMVMFLTISTIWVYAETNTDINFNIDGEVSKGKEVTININVDKADRLYGLSVDYTYNPEEIKVTSIQGAGLIKESKDNFFEAGGETAKDGNIANYQMTFTGEVDGISGSGTLVTIKAEVLKDTNLNLTEDNMKIKLIGINKDYKVSRMDFNLKEVKEDKKEETKEESKEENTEDSSKPKEENKNYKVDNELKEDKPTIVKKILKFFGVNNTNTQLQEEKNDNIKEENSKKDTSDESKKESKDNTEDKNVDTKKQDKDKENNKNTSSMLPVGVGGAVIVLVAAIVIFKLKNKKGNKGEF